jgi:outer membrane receptor protein involved in Fe transport
MEETAALSQAHRMVLYLPAITTLFSIFFCTQLFSRYRAKGGGLHLLWWGIGMATYGVGTFTEAYTSIVGWNETIFRAWYIAGAFLGGYPLAQGSIYLLMRRRFAHLSAIVVTSLIAIASIFVLLTPINTDLVETHRLSGQVIEWQWVRLISPFFNLYAVIFLVGGAIYSAIKFRRAGALRHRYIGNILIAIGAILPGIGGAMTRAGYVEALYVTELLGLVLIFGGYKMNIRRTVSVAPVEPASLTTKAAALLAALLLLPGLVLADPPAEETINQSAEANNAGETAEGEAVSGNFYGATTVTATGTRAETFGVAVPVTVLEQIDLVVPDSAADMLRTEVGVDVNGIGPNQARPIIRGQRGLRVLLLENGLRMNNARRTQDFGEIPSLVDINSVEQVEVVRGPASVLYGTDAIGGVLNLVTKTPVFADQVSGAIGLRASTIDDQGRGTANINVSGDRVAFQLGLSYRDAENYEAPSGTYGNITLEDETEVMDTGVQDQSLWGRFDYRFNDDNVAFFRFNRYSADDAGFGYIDPELIGEETLVRIFYPGQDYQKYTLGYEGLALDSLLADTLEVQGYYQQNERFLNNQIGPINIGPLAPVPGWPDSEININTENFTDVETIGLRAQSTKIAGDKQLLTYGAEFYEDDSFNTDFSSTQFIGRVPFPPFEFEDVDEDDIANTPNAINRSYGFFAQDEILLGNFMMTLGARYQNVTTKAQTTPGWDVTGMDFDDDAWVGAINLLYQVSPTFNITGSFGTAFRAPSIVERLFQGVTPEGIGYQILNPDLESENSQNIDFGFKYQARRTYANLTVFRNEISDGIIQYFLTEDEIAQLPPDLDIPPGTSFVVQRRNVEELEYEGVEVAGGYRFDNGFSLGGNYTYIDGKRIDNTNPPTGDTFSDKLNLFARYDAPSGRWWSEYRVRRNGDEDANLDVNEPIPPIGPVLPGFTIHRLGGGVVFNAGSMQHRLGLIVDNLTDELYAEFSNISFFRPNPGRNYIATYNFRF